MCRRWEEGGGGISAGEAVMRGGGVDSSKGFMLECLQRPHTLILAISGTVRAIEGAALAQDIRRLTLQLGSTRHVLRCGALPSPEAC